MKNLSRHCSERSQRSDEKAVDEFLLRRVARGDESAFGELYDRYACVAYGLALRMLGESELAATVVEDAFVAVARIDSPFASNGMSVRSRLLALVHRRAVEALRSRSNVLRTRRTFAEEAQDANGSLSSGRERVASALAVLPDAQRQPLVPAYYDGMSVDELADRLGQSPETVRETLHAALHTLQQALAEQAAPKEVPAAEIEREPRREPERRRPRAGYLAHERWSDFAFGDGER